MVIDPRGSMRIKSPIIASKKIISVEITIKGLTIFNLKFFISSVKLANNSEEFLLSEMSSLDVNNN